MRRVIVIGGGAAGMMAAIRAAMGGHQVLLLEKNEKLGKKIYITGKGRCNLTNACDTESLFQNVLRNPKFLYSAFYHFNNWQTMEFFKVNGLQMKIERGERVFPVSDHSSDVIKALHKALKRNKVELRLQTEVSDVLHDADAICGVRCRDGKKLLADAVVVATGGISYPSTGSTGDGYRFARHMGHEVIPQFPALVPMDAKEGWVKELQGLSLKNVGVRIRGDKSVLYEEFGEMLFTHFGVSGPLILSASSVVSNYREQMPLRMEIDLKPALSLEQLDKRLLREFEEGRRRDFKNAIRTLFPAKLVPVMVAMSGINGEKKANELTKQERFAFASLIKSLPLTLIRFRDFNEAIITRGGVAVGEVNPSTMESKKTRGLYFAGEVLDVDALTGGFNLQIAWSTGHLAGDSVI